MTKVINNHTRLLATVIEEYSIRDDEWKIIGVFLDSNKAKQIYNIHKKRFGNSDYSNPGYLKMYNIIINQEYDIANIPNWIE